MRLSKSFLVVSALLCSSTGSLQAQFSSNPSFGSFLTHKSVDLTRKLPPVYDLHGKSVSVSVAQSNNSGQTNTELQSAIEKLLTSADSSVRVEALSADLTINGQITNFEPPKIESRTDGKTTTNTMVGGMNVAFRITESRGGHLVASGVASTQIVRDLGAGGGSTSIFKLPGRTEKGDKNVQSTIDAQNAMVADIGRQIASYLVITPEVVPVQLAVGGALKEPDRLAGANLWARDLEGLETLTPWPDPRLDAYRIYNIGVANEALAYLAETQPAAIKYLNEASIDYGKATAARPDEKYFLQPQNRIAAALEHYTKPTATAAATGGGRGVGGGTAAASEAPASDILTDDDVIDMVKAKVDESAILDAVQSAPKVKFDLGPKGLVRLANGGVHGKILTTMQQKAKTPAQVK